MLILQSSTLQSQTFSESNIGANLGLNIALGTHVNRFGIALNAYYLEDRIQINFSTRIYKNFSSFGPEGSSNELKLSLGACAGFGPDKNFTDAAFLNPVSNQGNYRYSAGYAYSILLASNGTSQPMGMIGFHLNRFLLVHENDILAGTGDDKFRTGGLLVAFQDKERQYAFNYMGWTGDPRSEGAVKEKNSDYPSRKGYKDLSQAKFGNYSHGILAVQMEQLFDYGQIIRLQAGIDAEQIRNTMQNQLMHEKITGGYHYPMLQENGNPYLFRSGEKIRPSKPYLELMLNPTLFY